MYAVVDDAEAAHRFMVESVGLPTAWPFGSYGTFASGGVGLGNLNLEFISSGSGRQSQHPTRIAGVALEPAAPADEELLAELDRRDIGHSPLMPSAGWTNVVLEAGDLGAVVFVCDYRSLEAEDEARRRAMLGECGGGQLGLREAAEIVIGTPVPSRSHAQWRRLLDPLEPASPSRWTIGTGPALRLVPHERFEVLDLVLAVEAAEAARQAWLELVAEASSLDALPMSFCSD